jgi:hypothetical protein
MVSLGICGLPTELPRESSDKTPRKCPKQYSVKMNVEEKKNLYVRRKKKTKQREEKETVGAFFHHQSENLHFHHKSLIVYIFMFVKITFRNQIVLIIYKSALSIKRFPNPRTPYNLFCPMMKLC